MNKLRHIARRFMRHPHREKLALLVLMMIFVLGLIFGLTVLGWWLFPVEWTGGWPSDMTPAYQETYVRAVADLFAYNRDAERARALLGGWGGDSVACSLAGRASSFEEWARLVAVAHATNGVGCK